MAFPALAGSSALASDSSSCGIHTIKDTVCRGSSESKGDGNFIDCIDSVGYGVINHRLYG